MRPIAYLMEQTLGSVTHYLNLRREESSAPDPPRWVPVDYAPSRVPWTVTGGMRAREAIRGLDGEVSGLFVHTTTIALLAADLFGKLPAVLSSDGTPANKDGMREAYGLAPQSRLAAAAKRALYRAAFRRARGFVAWSSWTKASFVEDYGCDPEDVEVIPPGIHLDEFAPGDRAHPLPRILFVGGDFVRKGGDLLLDVFRKRLRGRAELHLVTREGPPDEPGVTVHRGIAANSPALRSLYATSDLFALPTRGDCFPLACMEALAAGLPLVGTAVGGMGDLVSEGETGHLVRRDDAAALGDALEGLVADPLRRRTMGAAARAEAARRFEVRANAARLFAFVRARCA